MMAPSTIEELIATLSAAASDLHEKVQTIEATGPHLIEARARLLAVETVLVAFLPLLTASMPPDLASGFFAFVRTLRPANVDPATEQSIGAHVNRLVDGLEAARREFSQPIMPGMN